MIGGTAATYSFSYQRDVLLRGCRSVFALPHPHRLDDHRHVQADTITLDSAPEAPCAFLTSTITLAEQLREVQFLPWVQTMQGPVNSAKQLQLLAQVVTTD